MARRGERHHKAKLSDSAVREMRALYERWKASAPGHHPSSSIVKGYGHLAMIYGVSPWTCRDIVTYRTRYGL